MLSMSTINSKTIGMFLSAVLVTFIAIMMTISASFAAGDEPKEDVKTCKDGYVWSDKYKKCVKKTSEILSDEDLYKTAVANIKANNYKEGLDLLWRIKNQNQPKVLNYIGFANRKLGRIDEGISYYHKALKIDANYNQARQYLGEGYLQKGDVKGAKNQLNEIAKRCGTGCDYYTTLKDQVAAYEKQRATNS